MVTGSGGGRAKGSWSAAEDAELRRLVENQGAHTWSEIAAGIPGRSGKSCRLRWCNQLSPDVHHQPFTPEEDEVIVREHAVHGNKWAAIARLLPGRTDNAIKNHFNSTLRRLKRRRISSGATLESVLESSESDSVINCEVGVGGLGAMRVQGSEGPDTMLSLMPPGGSLAEEGFGAARITKGGSIERAGDHSDDNLERPLGKEEEILMRNMQRIIAKEVKNYVGELIKLQDGDESILDSVLRK